MTEQAELYDLIRRANGSGDEAAEARRHLVAVGYDAVPAIIHVLRQGETLIQPLVRLIGSLAQPDHLVLLEDALFENNYDQQVAAADALGRIGGEDALEPLTRFLGDSSFGVVERAAAAKALGRIGRVEAVPALLRFGAVGDEIEDDNIEYGGSREIVISSVAVALARLGRHDFGPKVIELLSHPFPPTRALAAEALQETVAPGMLPALAPLLFDRDREVADNAVEAIYLLGAKQCVNALLPVLDRFGSDVRANVALRLLDLTGGEPADDESAEEYLAWWADEQSTAPDNVVLWKLEPRSVAHLVALLHDPSRRRDAAWELGLMGTEIMPPQEDDGSGWSAVVAKANSWMSQDTGFFRPGRLYKHRVEVDLAPLLVD